MTQVLARSRDSTRSSGTSNVFLRREESPYKSAQVDYSAKSIDELQSMVSNAVRSKFRVTSFHAQWRNYRSEPRGKTSQNGAHIPP